MEKNFAIFDAPHSCAFIFHDELLFKSDEKYDSEKITNITR